VKVALSYLETKVREDIWGIIAALTVAISNPEFYTGLYYKLILNSITLFFFFAEKYSIQLIRTIENKGHL
jgi:hypothetical protein